MKRLGRITSTARAGDKDRLGRFDFSDGKKYQEGDMSWEKAGAAAASTEKKTHDMDRSKRLERWEDEII
jgi:hypothetical protein